MVQLPTSWIAFSFSAGMSSGWLAVPYVPKLGKDWKAAAVQPARNASPTTNKTATNRRISPS